MSLFDRHLHDMQSRRLEVSGLHIGALGETRELHRRRGLPESPYSVYPTIVEIYTRAVQGGGGATAGAFYTMYVDEGNTFLQGGTVGAGVGSESLADYDVTGGTEGDILYIDVDIDAILDDDNEIMIPGVEVSDASYATGTSVPDNAFPGVSTTGHVYLEIGRWNATTFLPSGAGNFMIAGCNGNYDISRV